MAFLVFAFGSLMTLAGAYEIYVGNSIISVERGWSAFISGTVLLTGGLVTVALGFAIHALTDLKRVLGGAAVAGVGTVRNEPLASPLPPVAAAPNMAEPELRPAFAEDWEALDASRLDHGGTTSPTAIVATEAAAEPGSNASFAGAPLEHGQPVPGLRPSLAGDAPAAPGMDDWLERSFADLDRDSARDAARAASARAHPTPNVPAAVEPLRADPVRADYAPAGPLPADRLPADSTADHLHAEPEPDERAHAPDVELERAATWPDRSGEGVSALGRAVADHAAPVQPVHAAVEPERAADAAPVIGRYEAEGTSYVMYADGSIEAQSAAGVYRFASMAELKAFIES